MSHRLLLLTYTACSCQACLVLLCVVSSMVSELPLAGPWGAWVCQRIMTPTAHSLAETLTLACAGRRKNPNQVAFLAVLGEINAAALADAEQLLAETQALGTRTMAQYTALVQEAGARTEAQGWDRPAADEARCWPLDTETHHDQQPVLRIGDRRSPHAGPCACTWHPSDIRLWTSQLIYQSPAPQHACLQTPSGSPWLVLYAIQPLLHCELSDAYLSDIPHLRPGISSAAARRAEMPRAAMQPQMPLTTSMQIRRKGQGLCGKSTSGSRLGRGDSGSWQMHSWQQQLQMPLAPSPPPTI